ncbi:unnamed protein product [Caenorhabditis brenneri]
MNQDEVAKALLGMAEALRTQDPPKLKMAIKCARATLTLEVSEETKTICNFQLGKLLYFYTDNFELARTHLHFAYEKMVAMGTFYTQNRVQALTMLADLHMHYQQWPLLTVKNALRQEITHSHAGPMLLNKMIFQLIEILKIEKNVDGALELCQGAINSSQNDPKMELYFRISKTLVTYQLMHEEPNSAEVKKIGEMIKGLETSNTDRAHIECIKDFFVCTKLAYMFYEGKSRTSRTLMRQIQKQQTSGESTVHGIRWLGEGAMTIFACVMNAICALVQSNTDRVEKYYHLVMKHADEIIFKSSRSPQEPGMIRCINMIKMATLEMMACCNVMACRPQNTLANVRDMLEMCNRSSGPLLFRYFAPHIQYVLGLQSIYFRKNESAERHFQSAIQMLYPDDCTSNNTRALLNLNLAMTYLNQLKMKDYYEVAENLTGPKIKHCSSMVKSNVQLLNSYFFYLTHKLPECKKLLQMVFDDSKAEDFFRMHGLALLILSTFSPVDEMGVKPTVDWSKKSYDHVVIWWSHHIYQKCLEQKENPDADLIKMAVEQQELSKQTLSVENLRPLIDGLSESILQLFQWYEGDPYKLLPRDEVQTHF